MRAPDVEARIVEQWAVIYDAVYQTDDPPAGPDFAGWRSSITGEDYSEKETAEWLAGTVGEIRRLHPTSVLDVGAGSGLVARELLAHVRRYVGTDIAPTAVARLNAGHRADPRASFLVRGADDVHGLGTFEVVVLNSVIQHFPSAGYLRRALERAIDACAPGGAVFVGDVHSLPLRELLYLCAVEARARGPLCCGAVRDQLAAAAARERELVVDPAFFTAFAAVHGMAADVRLKPGRCATEMNLFRYDVWLRHRTEGLIRPEAVPRLPWRQGGGADVLARVSATALPAVVTSIPRPELAPLVAALDTVRRRAPEAPAELDSLVTASSAVGPGPGIVPADLVGLAADRGLACYCTPCAVDPARYDAVFAVSAERGGRHSGLVIAAGRPTNRSMTTSPCLQNGEPLRR